MASDFDNSLKVGVGRWGVGWGGASARHGGKSQAVQARMGSLRTQLAWENSTAPRGLCGGTWHESYMTASYTQLNPSQAERKQHAVVAGQVMSGVEMLSWELVMSRGHPYPYFLGMLCEGESW